MNFKTLIVDNNSKPKQRKRAMSNENDTIYKFQYEDKRNEHNIYQFRSRIS